MRCAGDRACVWPVVELVRDPAGGGLEGFCVHHLRMLSEPDAAAAYANSELMAPARGVQRVNLHLGERRRPGGEHGFCERCGQPLGSNNSNGRLCYACGNRWRGFNRAQPPCLRLTIEKWLGRSWQQAEGSRRAGTKT